MKDKTIAIPITTRNNLEYLKLCLKSLKKNTTGPYKIYLYLDACTDGTKDWLNSIDHEELNIAEIKENPGPNRLGLTAATNRVMDMVAEDIFILGHSDMYFGPGWDTVFKNALKPGRSVCLTRVEPPIFNPEPCKISEPLGNFPDEFDEEGFLKLHEYLIHKGNNKLTYGQFAPYGGFTKEWMKYKVDENLCKQSHEETDEFIRRILDEQELRQTWGGFVYHFGGRGDRFKTKNLSSFDKDWSANNELAFRNFVRKWNIPPQMDKWSYPILPRLLKNGKPEGVSAIILTKDEEDNIYDCLRWIEPFFDDIVIVDDESKDGTLNEVERYIKETSKCPKSGYFNPDKIKIHNRKLNKNFAAQKNFGISKAKNNWIFHIDADEKPEYGILMGLHPIITRAEQQGFNIMGFPRKNIVDGKQTEVYPDVQYRFHRRDIEWEGTVHEHPRFEDNKVVVIQHLHIIHEKSKKRHNERNSFYNEIKKGAGQIIKE